MKKSFIYIFSAFCFSCGINSCSFLDENPADRLVVDNFYTSEKDAQAAVDATYQQLNSLYNRLIYDGRATYRYDEKWFRYAERKLTRLGVSAI